RLHALTDSVRHADRRHAVLHGDPVGVRIRAEEGVEGAVLLHDHDDVADLVDAAWRGDAAVARRGGAATRARAGGEQEGEAGEAFQLNGGWSGRMSGGRGFWPKSKSWTRLPRIFAFSRTSGRESGRPSVRGLMRRACRKSSSMNLRYASELSTWWSM